MVADHSIDALGQLDGHRGRCYESDCKCIETTHYDCFYTTLYLYSIVRILFSIIRDKCTSLGIEPLEELPCVLKGLRFHDTRIFYNLHSALGDYVTLWRLCSSVVLG